LSGHTFEPHEGSFSYNRIRTPHRKPRRTTDGWIVILPYSQDNWQRFWAFGGRPEYLDDGRFATRATRVDHADALYSLLDGIVATKSTAEWLDFCTEYSIPASEVIELEHLGDDPHFAAVKLIRSDEHPTEGSYHYVRDPIRIDGTTQPLRHHAPRLGADTEAILAELDDFT
jgi:crotonobetainyl-CoA:carnitine CoA-transferase CaiB-like acyl-CoA transferase